MDSERMLEVVDVVARAFVRETDDDFREVVRAYLDDPVQGLPEDAQRLADRGARKLAAVLASRESAEDQGEWDDYLDADYADLFLGVAAGSNVPQESVYYSAERVTHQKPFFEVYDLMAEHGFAKPAGCLEPEDQIGLEWLFYGHLLRQAQDGVDGPAEAAAAFKERHMDAWMPQSLQDIVDADEQGYYAGMAYLAQALLLAL